MSQAKTLPDTEVRHIQNVIGKARSMALGDHDRKAMPSARTAGVLRAWVGRLGEARAKLDDDGMYEAIYLRVIC